MPLTSPAAPFAVANISASAQFFLHPFFPSFPFSAIFRALMSSPEELARENIDKLLTACGWKVQDRKSINLGAAQGVALREALLKDRDEVDYLLFVQPGRPDPDPATAGPTVRHTRRRPQVHRALQRPAPAAEPAGSGATQTGSPEGRCAGADRSIVAARSRQPHLHLHHPASLLYAAFFVLLG
jgi:hypothetical protein